MMKLLKKWDLSIIYKALLVVLDIVFINASSFLALWIRFNMQISEIPAEYYTSVLDLVVVNTIVTVRDLCCLQIIYKPLEICEYQRTGICD